MEGIPYEKGYGATFPKAAIEQYLRQPGQGGKGLPPVDLGIQAQDLITQIKEFFQNLFGGIPTQGIPYGEGYGATGGDTEQFSFIERLGEGLGQKIQSVSEGLTTNLKIQSTSNIQLIVDGRTLAKVI